MSRVIYKIPNISCAHCVHTIQLELSEIEGIKSVIANPETKKVDIVYDVPADESKIKNLLKEINYPVKEE